MTRRKTAKSNAASAAASPNDEIIFGEDGAPETPAAGLTDAEKALMEDLKAKEKEPAESSAEPAAASVAFAPAAEPEPEAAADEPERRERRGRPKGSTGKKKKDRQEPESAENLTKLLLNVHEMLAAFMEIPELLLSQGEAEKMGEAIHDVEALYGELPYISPEVRAWSNLVVASALVYWPRYKVIRMRQKAEAARDIDVTPIRPNGSGVAPNMSREGTGSVS